MLNPFASPGGPTLPELARQCLSSTEGGYDRLAPKFDTSVFRSPDWMLQPLLRHIPAGGVERALDIGCGTGAVLELLRPHVAEWTGLDLSAGMLSRARRNLGLGPQLYHGDILNTYWEERFDLITSVGVMGHIPPQAQSRFFERVHSALRPGGAYLTLVADLRARPYLNTFAQVFDMLMRLRNRLWRPAFVMYYLSFVLPEALAVVEASGLQAEVYDSGFPEPYAQLKVLRACRPSIGGT